HFTNLRRLNMTENNLISIDLSTLTSLEYLSVNDNNLSVVDITGLSELIEIHIADNMVTEIDLSGCPNVEILQVEGNSIPVLDVSGLPNLVNLSCAGIGISELDLSNASALATARISNNSISTLDLSAAINLGVLLCNDNNLTELDLTGLTQLTNLNLDNNPITELDISTLSSLWSLNASGTLLETFDTSNNPDLCLVHLSDSPNLETLNLKNGPSPCSEYGFLNNPNLYFVCTDEAEVMVLANYFSTNNMPQVNVNSYCTFTPGGDYNTITGGLRFDVDIDGCDIDDSVVPLTGVGIDRGDQSGISYTNQHGSYSFFTLEGGFIIAPILENQSYFNVIPPVA